MWSPGTAKYPFFIINFKFGLLSWHFIIIIIIIIIISSLVMVVVVVIVVVDFVEKI